MSKVVAIHQPNFLPWLGYFHKMDRADQFALLDNAQFPKGSYANRVKIVDRLGREKWLTVPVRLSKGSTQLYNEIEIAYDQKFQVRHTNLIRDAYQKAPFFDRYFDELIALLRVRYPNLAALNIKLIRYLKEQLRIQTPLEVTSQLGENLGEKNVRNLRICQVLGADSYLSGKGARAYNDEALFASYGIRLVYQQFECPRYPQLHGAFIPNLSVIDLLFNCGPDSRAILEKA
jgi:hypothetical protein